MNSLQVSGHVATQIRDGGKVVSFSIADNRKIGKDGKEETIFHSISVWGEENCRKARRIQTGDFVVAQGRMSKPVAKEKDGKLYVNYDIVVSDSNLWSYINFDHKADTVVNDEPSRLSDEDFDF